MLVGRAKRMVLNHAMRPLKWAKFDSQSLSTMLSTSDNDCWRRYVALNLTSCDYTSPIGTSMITETSVCSEVEVACKPWTGLCYT